MVGVAGLLLGGVLGAVLSKTLVTIPDGSVRPAAGPAGRAVPYLAAVTALGVACLAAAGTATTVAARRPPVTVLRDL